MSPRATQQQQQPYAQVTLADLALPISSNALRVLAYLRIRCWSPTGPKPRELTYSDLRAAMPLGKDATSTAVRELVDAGLVTATARPGNRWRYSVVEGAQPSASSTETMGRASRQGREFRRRKSHQPGEQVDTDRVSRSHQPVEQVDTSRVSRLDEPGEQVASAGSAARMNRVSRQLTDDVDPVDQGVATSYLSEDRTDGGLSVDDGMDTTTVGDLWSQRMADLRDRSASAYEVIAGGDTSRLRRLAEGMSRERWRYAVEGFASRWEANGVRSNPIGYLVRCCEQSPSQEIAAADAKGRAADEPEANRRAEAIARKEAAERDRKAAEAATAQSRAERCRTARKAAKMAHAEGRWADAAAEWDIAADHAEERFLAKYRALAATYRERAENPDLFLERQAERIAERQRGAERDALVTAQLAAIERGDEETAERIGATLRQAKHEPPSTPAEDGDEHVDNHSAPAWVDEPPAWTDDDAPGDLDLERLPDGIVDEHEHGEVIALPSPSPFRVMAERMRAGLAANAT